jgi:hypothetical protein
MLKRLVQFIKSRILRKTMYPELEKIGGLANALNNEFENIKSSLRVSIEKDKIKMPFTYVRVEHGSKFSQIYIAANEKLYLPDFWRDGVCLANGQTKSIVELAKVIDYWLSQNVSTKLLSEKFEFVSSSEGANAFDEGNEVQYKWNNMLLVENSFPELMDFINLASKDEILSKLFPFTSLYTLCFSRCTGYPFSTENIPNVTPKQHQFTLPKNKDFQNKQETSQLLHTDKYLYIVTNNKSEYLGEGNAEEALKLVKENLPNNIGPAIKGTADNIIT